MATKELVTKVWIEPGCIVCDACEDTCPEVFDVTDTTCLIRPAALNIEFTKPITQRIIEAAQECPVDVIKFETAPFDVPEDYGVEKEEAAAAPAAAGSAPEPAKAAASHSPSAPAPKAKAEPAKAVASKAPETPEERDANMQALLRAAAGRGGHAGIERFGGAGSEAAAAISGKSAAELPPDARQAVIAEAARKQKQARTSPDRRAFLSTAAVAVGWAGLGVATAGSGLAFGRFMMPNVLEEPDPRVRVGPLSKYATMQPGEVNEDYKPQGIWMIREEGRVAALNIICTHLGCIPNWIPNDRKFKCPCHGSGYYANGVNFEGPTPRPLERFRISVVDGIVVVDKSKKYQQELGQWDTVGSFLEV